MQLLTLTLAKQHLRVTSTDEDTLLESYILMAEAAVFGWIKFPSIEYFYYEFGEGPFPRLIAAALLALRSIYDGRGTEDMYSPAFKSLLRDYRQPTQNEADVD
jgi:hypothetical protein